MSLIIIRLRRVLVTFAVIFGAHLHPAVSIIHAQGDSAEVHLGMVRERLVPLSAAGAVLYAGSLTGLYVLWYADHEQTRFHFFNDNDQWLQMDKVGHAMTAYYLTEVSDRALMYSGVDRSTSLIVGSMVSFSYLGLIEVFDGFSAEWGFSVGDMAANVTGIALYTGQELLWRDQRVKLRYNFLPSPYSAYRPDVLGDGFLQQALKDYNGQAYWLSTNPHSWMDARQWPRWLNVAVGYSAAGMTGGSENLFPLLEPGAPVPDFNRRREFYLSVDLDLHGIEARRNWFKAFRSVFGFVKIPAPAIGFDSEGRLIGGIR